MLVSGKSRLRIPVGIIDEQSLGKRGLIEPLIGREECQFREVQEPSLNLKINNGRQLNSVVSAQ